MVIRDSISLKSAESVQLLHTLFAVDTNRVSAFLCYVCFTPDLPTCELLPGWPDEKTVNENNTATGAMLKKDEISALSKMIHISNISS